MSENPKNTIRFGIFEVSIGSLGEIRARVLQTLSWFIIIVGIGLLIFRIPSYLQNDSYIILALELLSFGILLALTIFQKRVSFRIRAITLIAVVFIQGLTSIPVSGLAGDSRIWHFLAIILATVLFGINPGMITGLFSYLSFFIGSFLITNEYITLTNEATIAYNASGSTWVELLLTFILMSQVVTTVLGLVVRGMEQSNEQLEEAYEETQALTEQLAAEEEQLRKQAATLEKRTRYIEAAAEVGKAATSIYNLDEMLDQVVEMISERFGFYQTGIFLIDERSEFAEMVAASSEGGKRMLARGHKLKVGQEGMVGYVTSQGQARIALDVGDEAVYFSNPELPLTRSEMTLPMFYGGRIFGALDVQSTMEHAFTQEDISSLSVLADQVTMAINNARLIEELQSSLRSEREAFGEVSRQAWHNLIRRAGSWGYRFSNNRTNPTEKEWPQEMIRAMERQDMVIASDAKGALSIPIMVSGAPVGAIRVEKPAESVDWTEDEIDLIKTLTERLSQALESARVYQASQTQAIQEQLTTEISGQLRQTLDIDTVLKTAAKQLGDAFNAKEVVIRMAPDESRN